MRRHHRARRRTTRVSENGQRRRRRAPRPKRHVAGCKPARPASGCEGIAAHVVERPGCARKWSTAAQARAETKRAPHRLQTNQTGELMRLHHRARRRTTRVRAKMVRRRRRRAPRPRGHLTGCKRTRPASRCDCITAHVVERPGCARKWSNGGAGARRDQEDTSPTENKPDRRVDATASPRTS